MGIIKNTLLSWVDASFNVNDGYAILIIAWVINIGVSFLLYMFIIKPFLYVKKYSHTLVDNTVKVTRLNRHDHTTTTFIPTGKTLVPITHTVTCYDVHLKGDEINQKIDNFRLYHSLRVGQEVTVKYKKIYEAMRFSSEINWKFVKNEILDVKI